MSLEVLRVRLEVLLVLLAGEVLEEVAKRAQHVLIVFPGRLDVLALRLEVLRVRLEVLEELEQLASRSSVFAFLVASMLLLVLLAEEVLEQLVQGVEIGFAWRLEP